ncbi:hypothetical protein BT93_L3283 [Corymbia citriodora subsp. variegata]|uniref:Uncharacterized protein n=1 Tax=Corymbia citriodora subsp. variegata TaxID=360336 RepID=A0A8T0CHH0_CORYI|nr:hypothetical protein BT93_L3283 [Corymbia citriodora subsp. variegata]
MRHRRLMNREEHVKSLRLRLGDSHLLLLRHFSWFSINFLRLVSPNRFLWPVTRINSQVEIKPSLYLGTCFCPTDWSETAKSKVSFRKLREPHGPELKF